MPKRTDLHKILIIGSGPIVIGQACEFDYSGTQACKALMSEGYEVVLVNSNPATIMTDPETADRTYVEPIDADIVAKIIEKERPDALLPTLGGQTGLNTAIEVFERGVLDQFGVEMIGASNEAIQKAEDREQFKDAMIKCGLDLPKSYNIRARLPKRPDELTREALEKYEAARLAALNGAVAEARDRVMSDLGLPVVIRPSFTLGGTGGGIAYNLEEFEDLLKRGLEYSLIGEVLVEESIIGWKEFELEVMRDNMDNVVIICSIENFDPMGVHTGDSITVAPAQTLTDKEYQAMRDASIAIIREIGVETGGSNIQFAINPENGRMVVIEMNPRVSRSSALASKATGFPIAKIAAKLAVGYTLDEIPNDITRETYASFEPTIDYCVTKFPRWAFEKFPEADPTLTTQMKSVGEVMAIGRTFKESFQKALRSLETGRFGYGLDPKDWRRSGRELSEDDLIAGLSTPGSERVFHIREAFLRGRSVEDVHELTGIDPWFLDNLQQIIEFESELQSFRSLDEAPEHLIREAKQMGFSDVQLATVWGTDPMTVRARRKALDILPTYKLVDTCAAEFEAYTPYYYSTYEDEDETRITEKPKIIILGGGPNRIGQGIEFDYCCVQASFALKELGFETIMVNSNPETVSTDYDTSNLLFFEPLTSEDVLNICDRLKPWGVIVQFGGQTPLNIAMELQSAGVPIIGTSPQSIALAEDREQFRQLLQRLNLQQAPSDTCWTLEQAIGITEQIGFPVLMRPSFVLGGAKMMIVEDREGLERYWSELAAYSARADVEISQRRPILIDKFLDDAIEVDVDCISDGTTSIVGAVMEHIELAGVHSGDSACAIPPYSLSKSVVEEIERQTKALAAELDVLGVMNVQYAVKGDQVYVLEVNPRASRTIPFVSKAIGKPLAQLAAKIMAGKTLEELGLTEEVRVSHFSVKEAALPFNKFPESDIILGPEMKSTGEVMGIDPDFGVAFAKSQMAVGSHLPMSGNVLITVRDEDKPKAARIARRFHEAGFNIVSTRGTWRLLKEEGIPAELILKIQEGRPNVLDALMNGDVNLVINTPSHLGSRTAEAKIRRYAVLHRIPVITTLAAGSAAISAIEALQQRELQVKALQDYHEAIAAAERDR